MEMDRKENFIPSHPNIMDVAKNFSEVSKNAGRYKFLITFTATEGNIKILQKFQKYAFDNANNEYLVAINKLLDYAEIMEYFKSIEHRVALLESELDVLKEKSKIVESNDDVIKTF
ncbi:MAG TPA: hypothetical protein V6C58_06560 [Allocoleopsis sp.]